MITFDIDNQDIGKLHLTLIMLRSKYPDKKIMWRNSCQKGFHIKILGVENDYAVRMEFGDDQKRIDIDQEREQLGLPINVLFKTKLDKKDGSRKTAGEWQIWEKNQLIPI